jgi:hypothetical protein
MLYIWVKKINTIIFIAREWKSYFISYLIHQIENNWFYTKYEILRTMNGFFNFRYVASINQRWFKRIMSMVPRRLLRNQREIKKIHEEIKVTFWWCAVLANSKTFRYFIKQNPVLENMVHDNCCLLICLYAMLFALDQNLLPHVTINIFSKTTNYANAYQIYYM